MRLRSQPSLHLSPQPVWDGFLIFSRIYFSCFFNCISHRFAIVYLHNSFQSPPLSQWGRIAHRIIFKIRKYFFVSFPQKTDRFCQNCCLCLWFALSLWTSSKPDSEASIQTNNSLCTCVFVCFSKSHLLIGISDVRAWRPCVDLPLCPAPPPLRCKPAAEPDRCSPQTATPGGKTRMRVTERKV